MAFRAGGRNHWEILHQAVIEVAREDDIIKENYNGECQWSYISYGTLHLYIKFSIVFIFVS